MPVHSPPLSPSRAPCNAPSAPPPPPPRYMFLSSSELLKLSFHPSCLLTVGDALAFTRSLLSRGPQAEAARIAAMGGDSSPATNVEKPPTLREQMALGASIMARVPQRCGGSCDARAWSTAAVGRCLPACLLPRTAQLGPTPAFPPNDCRLTYRPSRRPPFAGCLNGLWVGIGRYLIQNLSGMALTYWAPMTDGNLREVVWAHNKKRLAPGASEELQVRGWLAALAWPGGMAWVVESGWEACDCGWVLILV